MNLGQMISLRRKQSGLTIDDLVDKSGIAKGTLNKIIAGTTKDPGLSTVKAIAKALNCTLDDLDDIKKSPTPAEAEAEEKARIKEYASRVIDALVSLGFLAEHKDLTPRQRIVVGAVLQILAVEFGRAEGSTEYWDKVV